MKSGEYALPYRFKTFGSTKVVDPQTGELTPCTAELCPKAEVVPKKGHHADNDRASILPPSPLAGKLINRAPFFWSGDLGVMIRKSSPEIKKDLLWDFFVFTNSPDTSVHDVANYKSWLDSWRYSQLAAPGDNFINGGWPKEAYEEHAAIQLWANSNQANAALNLRIPGIAKYTRDVVGEEMYRFIDGEIEMDELMTRVREGWNMVTSQQGKLDQLETYRASLGLDSHSEVELCTLHRELMDGKDPSTCRQYDASPVKVLLPSVLVVVAVILIAIAIFIHLDRKRRNADCVWKIKAKELRFDKPVTVLGRGTFGLVLLAEYRGTQVAVKRVIPPKPNRSAKQGSQADKHFKDIEAGNSTNMQPDELLQQQSQMGVSSTAVSPGFSSGAMKSFSYRSTVSPFISRMGMGMGMGGRVRLKADFVEEMRHLCEYLRAIQLD